MIKFKPIPPAPADRRRSAAALWQVVQQLPCLCPAARIFIDRRLAQSYAPDAAEMPPPPPPTPEELWRTICSHHPGWARWLIGNANHYLPEAERLTLSRLNPSHPSSGFGQGRIQMILPLRISTRNADLANLWPRVAVLLEELCNAQN